MPSKAWRLFSDLSFVVDQQVTEGDSVASRWTLRGTNRSTDSVEFRYPVALAGPS
jgi:hypothetical protein